MKDKIKTKDVFISGLALFAIFFGAGNLILPTYIGVQAGEKWVWAWLAFTLSGPGLTFLGMVGMAKRQGSPQAFANRVHPYFAAILGSVIMLCIGPLMVIPRTGATTFEIAILPLYPEFPPYLFSLIFFAITAFFALKKTELIDIIGKFMTPLLLGVLFILIYKALQMEESFSPAAQHPFSLGFVEGYHTMDALSPMILAGMIIGNFRFKGIKDQKAITRHTIQAESIAAGFLGLVYLGLTYLGAVSHGFFELGMDRTEFLNIIVNELLGKGGSLFLGVIAALACLTTAIGLISATGNYFEELSKGKLKYNQIILVSTLLSFFLAVHGVENIMKFSVPILVSIYPVVIVLSLLNLIDEYLPRNYMYQIPIFLTFLVSLIGGLKTAGFKDFILVRWAEKLPLWELGFSWIPIFLLSFIATILYFYLKKEKI